MGNRGLGLLWNLWRKKIAISNFTGEKKGQSEIMQILFHTQLEMWREFNHSLFK